ncbi:MAG TPA: amidohydrolase [Chthoniobacterales bacterium]|nr:amidohydrolase [Chthoniobacterales bacterium]
MNRGFIGQKKIHAHVDQNQAANSSDTEKRRIGKNHNVKTSPYRQVKARISFGCALALLCALVSQVNAAEDVDLIFVNGNVYTVNERQPHAEAIAVKKDRILFVGSNEDAKKLKSEKTRVMDFHEHTVVPGLTDSHCHIFGIGEREMNLNLERTNTREDFLAKVKARVAQTGHGKWITGRGWIETFWKPPTFPTRNDLDTIAPDNPVFLTRADGHAAVVNSASLKIARIDKNTPNPFGGEILKDKKTGEPTGMLLDNAQDLVEKNIPKPTEADREQALLRGVNREVGLGWCEIQNAGSHKEDVDLIRKAFDAGKIKIRFINCVYGPGADLDWFFKEEPTINAYDHRFTQRTIKVIFDGALGSRGAALLKPYSDAPVGAGAPPRGSPSERPEGGPTPSNAGYLTEKPEDLKPMFEEALRRGLQVETHAIGDRANRTILDLYEAAFKAVPPEQRKVREPRWRVEHAQIVDLADIPRFAKLGVIPSMQPSHAISDLFFAPKRLGMDRLAGAYAWQSFLKSGSIICGGSDAPVERGEPMIEFYAAVARKSIKGESGEGWHPEQAVSREQALKMFTIWPAYAAFEEQDKGSIEVGKLADFTVLSQDVMKIPEPQILKTRSEMTVIGGEVLFVHWVRSEED